MAIIVNLDIEMAKNKISLTELAERLDMSMTNLSLLKNGRVKGVRFETLNSLCTTLNCEVGDILQYVSDNT